MFVKWWKFLSLWKYCEIKVSKTFLDFKSGIQRQGWTIYDQQIMSLISHKQRFIYKVAEKIWKP